MQKITNWEYRSVLAVGAVFVALLFYGCGQYEICLAVTGLGSLAAAVSAIALLIFASRSSFIAAGITTFVAAAVAAFAAAIISASATGAATGDFSKFYITIWLAVLVSASTCIGAEIASWMLRIKYVSALLGLVLEGVAIYLILRYGNSALLTLHE